METVFTDFTVKILGKNFFCVLEIVVVEILSGSDNEKIFYTNIGT
jgi:hypothetical protein